MAYILFKQHRIVSTEDWTLNRNSVATEPALALATQELCSPGSQPLDSQPAFQRTKLAVGGARGHLMCQGLSHCLSLRISAPLLRGLLQTILWQVFLLMALVRVRL